MRARADDAIPAPTSRAAPGRPRLPIALPLLGGLLAFYLLAPFVAGLGEFGLADWRGMDGYGLARASLTSVTSASLATLMVALGGIPLGYLLARVRGRAMGLLGFLVQLPLALPPLASGVLLLFLFGYASPLGRLSDGRLTDSFTGIVLAEAFVAAPFLIIAARSAFVGVDPVLEDVAATLGHRPGAVFCRVSLPLAWRVIWAGVLLTWLRAFGEFGATVMLAYHPTSLPIYTYVAFEGQGLPAMLPILVPTLAAAVLVMAASQVGLGGRRARHRRGMATAADPPASAEPSAVPSGAARGRPLALAYHRRLPGFTLDVAWRTDARRLAILGASGSGKSATLRLLAGLDRADAASLHFDGADLTALPAYARGIAYVPQSYALPPHLSVAEQVRFAVGCDAGRARHWIERLGLAGLEDRRPAELSLGQQQRVALARALARPSRLLLLDEPFSALDAPLRGRLRAEMQALQGEVEATTILVTHDPAEAMLLADEIALLDAGRVLRCGPVEDVYRRPGGEVAARLLGAESIAAGVAVGPDRIACGDVRLAVAGPPLAAGPVGWSVRAEGISLRADGGLEATLLRADEPRGGRRRLTLRLGDALLHATVDPGCEARPGPCRVAIDPATMQVWPRP